MALFCFVGRIDMITEGIKIMCIGMGTVFVMLGALVAATVISAGIIARMSPPAAPGVSEDQGPAVGERRSGGIAAAIMAAVTRFRKS